MPKGKKEKKNGKKAGGPRPPGSVIGSDEDSYSDVTSVSGMSDARSVRDLSDDECTVASVADTEETLVPEDNFEDEVKEAIENLSEKSLATRIAALTSLINGLRKRYVCEFLMERKVTMGDSLNKCLRKGKGEEQALSAQLAAILLLQIATADDPEIESIWSELRSTMQLILQDHQSSPNARAACASALGICSFIVGGTEERYSVLNSLETSFKESYLKGDSSTPNTTVELAAVHAKALHAWNLLLTCVPTNLVLHLIQTHLPKLPGILESSHVDLRIAAGESIALLYELAREEDEDFEGEDLLQLSAKLKDLSKDSSKYRAKKDRRQQRSCFRDIVRGVELGEPPEFQIRFGTEALSMDSWQAKITYEEICNALGVGMNLHLQKNHLIRDIFSLGAPLLEAEAKANLGSKFEKKQANAESFKLRSIHRGRNRDKRTAVF